MFRAYVAERSAAGVRRAYSGDIKIFHSRVAFRTGALHRNSVALLAGAQAPERIRFSIANVTGEPNPLDLSTVSAVSLSVILPDSARRVTWSATVVAQDAASLVVEHVFSLADVLAPGGYNVLAELTTPAGVRRAGPYTLTVRAR